MMSYFSISFIQLGALCCIGVFYVNVAVYFADFISCRSYVPSAVWLW